MDKLVIKNLKHSYDNGDREVEVLKGVNATFEPGKVYAIVGESGSGKTTFISLLAALDKIQSGDILYGGESIKEIGENVFRLRYVNIVFQSYNLIKYMTARENVEVALDFAKIKQPKPIAYDLLQKVGIKQAEADRLVQKLSGGQQQRVAIARAIAADSPIIVADEPTGNLDEKTAHNILKIFHELARAGKIVIIVTHSPKVAKSSGAKVLRMKNGLLKAEPSK